MAQLMPLTLTISCSSKSRLVIPFWYRLTRVVPDKGSLIKGVLLLLTMMSATPCLCYIGSLDIIPVGATAAGELPGELSGEFHVELPGELPGETHGLS